jgi:protein-disulfide isomerase
MKKHVLFVLLIGSLLSIVGCGSHTDDEQLKERMGNVLKENPDLLFDVIKEHPVEFMDVLQAALEDAKKVYAERDAEEEQKQLEQMLEHFIANPMQPNIRPDEAIRGDRDAPIVLIEYSDFECPFCGRGYSIVRQLMERYGKQLQFVYKHMPLTFHQHARLAAQYYEALRLQDPQKAFQFHDEVFSNQARLQEGEAFLSEVAKQTGADMTRLVSDLKSEQVIKRIEEDMQEAAAFGFNGTPAFIINGVPITGAYPLDHFEMVISKLKDRGVIKLGTTQEDVATGQ